MSALRLCRFAAAAAAAALPACALAQGYGPGGESVRMDLAATGPTRTLSLPRGKSAVIDLPTDARDVLVSDPKVADVVLSTPRRIYVVAQGPGATDAAFFDAAGRPLLRLNIRVDQDTSGIAETLNRLLPGGSIHVEAVNETLVLTGDAPNLAAADKAVRLAASFVSKPEQVVNMISIAEHEQVMLKVKIVEVNRSVIKQLGFDLAAVTGQLGMPQYSFLKSPTYGINGSYLGSLSGGYAVNTTSQPVSGFPFSSSLFSGLSTLFGSSGVNASNLSSVISGYLTGSSAVTAAQSSFSQSYLNGLLSTTTTQVTPVDPLTNIAAPSAHTVTASSAGVTSANLPALERAYLNGGTLSVDQRQFLNAFNSQLPSYNAAAKYSVTAGQDSTLVDRSNPANVVQNGRAGSSGLNQANAMIQAFERVGLVRTLAEPNLTAVSGEGAHFLAGGEFPVPIGQDNNGRVTVEFKPYGVGLGFTPIVLSRGRISLRISTEVSEPTSTGGFNLQTSNAVGSTPGSALSIPGLSVRRAETVVELPSGQGMMIAGLLQSSAKQTLDSLPGVMNLPILGALFRSRDFVNNESELVIIVTPYVVRPTNPDLLRTPADGLEIADDIQTNGAGRLNEAAKTPKPGAATPVAGPPTPSYQGPVGYVVD